MTLEVLGSSSSGNCYLLKGATETLILEAGIRFQEVKKALGFSFANVSGVLVSHRHGDHSKSVGDFLKYGIDVFAPEDALEQHTNHFAHPIKTMVNYRIGEFVVMALDAIHDVPCYAYVISHPEMGKLLFVTDSVSFDYSIKGVNHLMVEANYEDNILEQNILDGIEPSSMRNRLLCSHMELGTTMKVIKSQDASSVRDITLIHLSSRNSNEESFKDRVVRETGIPTYIAHKGMMIDF